MAKKPAPATLPTDLFDGFEEIRVTRTRHSEPTLYVNTADAKYAIARLSMGAVAIAQELAGDGNDVKFRLLHNRARHIGLLILDPAGYSVSDNGGLSGGAFQDARMFGPNVKAKFPVEVFTDGKPDGVRGLQFSTELEDAEPVADEGN